jgi:hypothetical protein
MDTVQAKGSGPRPERLKNLLPAPEDPVQVELKLSRHVPTPVTRLPQFRFLGDLRQQFDCDVDISQPLCFREHAAEKKGAFDPVSVARIGIDDVGALQEQLQKRSAAFRNTGFAAEASTKASPRDVSSKPHSAFAVFGFDLFD